MFLFSEHVAITPFLIVIGIGLDNKESHWSCPSSECVPNPSHQNKKKNNLARLTRLVGHNKRIAHLIPRMRFTLEKYLPWNWSPMALKGVDTKTASYGTLLTMLTRTCHESSSPCPFLFSLTSMHIKLLPHLNYTEATMFSRVIFWTVKPSFFKEFNYKETGPCQAPR